MPSGSSGSVSSRRQCVSRAPIDSNPPLNCEPHSHHEASGISNEPFTTRRRRSPCEQAVAEPAGCPRLFDRGVVLPLRAATGSEGRHFAMIYTAADVYATGYWEFSAFEPGIRIGSSEARLDGSGAVSRPVEGRNRGLLQQSWE